MTRMKLLLAGAGVALAVALANPAAAMFQRDPAYAEARASGQVGEKMDGFLGVVGNQSQEIRDLVADINIKRRANYTERARSQNVTVDAYALTQGCILIARTDPGEKYQAPDGSWKTRTTAPPERDSRCPPAG
ncbi:YdbL family probable chaperone protein [Alteriqipengyuania sp. 357]